MIEFSIIAEVRDVQKAFFEFGSSSNLIASICGKKPEFEDALAKEHELTFLAGCNYEKGTSWGTEASAHNLERKNQHMNHTIFM